MTKNLRLQTLRGFRDFLPKDAQIRQYVIEIIKKTFELYGFEPLETPALEYAEILLGKYGHEGDKLMYRFQDHGKRHVALRYDQTVPLARVIAQYGGNLPFPFKRYQIQTVWRGENPQQGRLREFLQCDADIVGSSSLFSDAEVIELAAKTLENLGIKNYKILINDREELFNFYQSFGLPPEKIFLVIRALDKLKKIGMEAVKKEIATFGISKKIVETIFTEIKKLKPNKLFPLLKLLDNAQIPYQYESTLARGLDYYTGLIFEIEIEKYHAGSVCGGGRYDNLIGMFCGKKIPAVGFAFGFDRLIEALKTFSLLPPLFTTKVLVTIFSCDFLDKSWEITKLLRQNGINTEIYLEKEAKLEKQLKYADKKQIPYVLIIGPEELRTQTVTLKNMKTTEQKTISISDLLKILKTE